MIYNIQTFITYGYWPDTDLKPQSHKPIIAACDGCGKIRVTAKHSYSDLCPSCSGKKRYEDPKEREKTSLGVKQAHIDDPTISERKSKSHFKLCEDPKEREKLSIIGKKRYEDPEEREKTGLAVKQAHIDDPNLSQRQSESQQKRYEDPEEREKTGLAVKKHYDEMDDPGLEICKHHYIYDFNDLDKYTIEVTRSEHTTIHNNLRRAGLEVPHINIMKDD